MKQFNLFIIVFIAAFIFISVDSALSFTYYGEYCWRKDEGGSNYSIFKLAVSDLGGNHLSLNGIEVDSQGVPNLDGEIVHGNGEIIGSNVILLLHTTDNNNESTGVGTYYIKLSLDTLSDTYNAIGTEYDKLAEQMTATEYGFGAFVYVPCP